MPPLPPPCHQCIDTTSPAPAVEELKADLSSLEKQMGEAEAALVAEKDVSTGGWQIDGLVEWVEWVC
jgi:hypothetical protein